MQLFYAPYLNENDVTFSFDKEESRHITKVLRKKEGSQIFLTNGKGYLFTSQISTASEKKCEVKILSTTFYPNKKYRIHIAIAPTKMNDRFEWFLEKATEIGINEITPLICEHSERKVYKIDRAEKIIQSAMKQSLQHYLPKINPPENFKNFISKELNFEKKFIAHCEETEKKLFQNSFKKDESILILIGPEGDFSTFEIKFAMENKFIPVSLGSNRLRTETAALVACHTVSIINDF